jgi:hypothetical protein
MSGLKLEDGNYILNGTIIDQDKPTKIIVVTDTKKNEQKMTIAFKSGNNNDFIFDPNTNKYGMGLTILTQTPDNNLRNTNVQFEVSDLLGMKGTLTRIGDEVKDGNYNLTGTLFDIDKPTRFVSSKINNNSQITLVYKSNQQVILTYDKSSGKYLGASDNITIFKNSDGTYVLKDDKNNAGKLEIYIFGEKITPGRYTLLGTKYNNSNSLIDVAVTNDNRMVILDPNNNQNNNIFLNYDEKSKRYGDVYAVKDKTKLNAYIITDDLNNTGLLEVLQSRIPEGEYTIDGDLFNSDDKSRVTILSQFDLMIVKNTKTMSVVKYNPGTGKYGNIFAYRSSNTQYTLLQEEPGKTTITGKLTIVNLFEPRKLLRGSNVISSKEFIHSISLDKEHNFAIYFKTADENPFLDVGGNKDGTKGFIVLNVYDYYKNGWRQIDRTSMQNDVDYRGNSVQIKKEYIKEQSEWDGNVPLKIEVMYTNSSKTNIVDSVFFINNQLIRYSTLGQPASQTPQSSNNNVSDVNISCSDMNKLIQMVFETQLYANNIKNINDIKEPFAYEKNDFNRVVDEGDVAATKLYNEIKKYKCETKTAPVLLRKNTRTSKNSISMKFASLK